jgi:hypothetical protein
MPELRHQAARYAMIRWAQYLSDLTGSMKPRQTQEKIANALNIDTGRLRQWRRRDRGAESDAVFDHGEALRDEFAWETSGIEALYAYGYFSDVLRLLKHISVDRANKGPHIAVVAYCTLPVIFIEFEREVLKATLDWITKRDRDAAEVIRKRYRYDIARFDAESTTSGMGGFLSVQPQAATSGSLEVRGAGEAIELLRAKGTRKVISRAWKHVLADRLLPNPSPDEPPLEYIGEDNLLFIEAIIKLSRQMTDTIPTLAVVRLWRMLAEWADHVEYGWGRDFIPDAFSTFDTVQRRIADEEAWAYESAMQVAADSWRGK